jgi:hypothetical protein
MLTGWAKYLHEAFCKVYLREDEHAQNVSLYTPLYLSMLFKISVFFGLPTTLGEDEELLTGWRIVKNFIGWPSEGQSYARMPFVFIWNLIKVITLTLWQPIRFITEFVPYVLQLYWNQVYKDEVERQGDHTKTNSMKFRLGLRLFITYFFFFVWIIGLATTSPIDSILEMFSRGSRLSKQNRYVSIAFAVISIILSIAVYTACFPFAIQAILTYCPVPATIMANYMITHLPGLVSAGSSVISSTAAIFNGLEVLSVLCMVAAFIGNLALRAIYYCTSPKPYTEVNKQDQPGSGQASFVDNDNGYRPRNDSESKVVFTEADMSDDEALLAEERAQLEEEKARKQEALNTPGLSLYTDPTGKAPELLDANQAIREEGPVEGTCTI